MLYKPGEIAEELGITVETVLRAFIPAGAPVVIDSEKHTWINGKDFARWAKAYLAQKHNRPRNKMLPGQAYCLRCNQVVEMQDPKRRHHHRDVDQISGRCPVCKGKINRFVGEKSK